MANGVWLLTGREISQYSQEETIIGGVFATKEAGIKGFKEFSDPFDLRFDMADSPLRVTWESLDKTDLNGDDSDYFFELEYMDVQE
jgi:hypothetical protein